MYTNKSLHDSLIYNRLDFHHSLCVDVVCGVMICNLHMSEKEKKLFNWWEANGSILYIYLY